MTVDRNEGTDSKLVLVIEDDLDTRFLLTFTLEAAGYRVVAAGDGKEAILYLASRAPLPSMILLDLMMPVMNGWEFRREQRKDPALAEIPVVILSAATDVARQADALGVANYLVKPMDVADVVAVARKYC